MARSEEWRAVPGFEGELIASSHGRVARVTGFDYSGYMGVSVADGRGFHMSLLGGRNKHESYVIPVHRIVALTFLGEPPRGRRDVNHKDGNKKNNASSNLEWCSRGENMQHAWRAGLANNTLKRYTEADYKRARKLHATGKWTWKALAEHLGITVAGLFYMVKKSPRGRTRAWQEAA